METFYYTISRSELSSVLFCSKKEVAFSSMYFINTDTIAYSFQMWLTLQCDNDWILEFAILSVMSADVFLIVKIRSHVPKIIVPKFRAEKVEKGKGWRQDVQRSIRRPSKQIRSSNLRMLASSVEIEGVLTPTKGTSTAHELSS